MTVQCGKITGNRVLGDAVRAGVADPNDLSEESGRPHIDAGHEPADKHEPKSLAAEVRPYGNAITPRIKAIGQSHNLLWTLALFHDLHLLAGKRVDKQAPMRPQAGP